MKLNILGLISSGYVTNDFFFIVGVFSSSMIRSKFPSFEVFLAELELVLDLLLLGDSDKVVSSADSPAISGREAASLSSFSSISLTIVSVFDV